MKRLLFSLIALSLCFSLFSCGQAKNADSLLIHVLNVGKADCIVIQEGENTVVIDCGEEENFPTIASFLEQNKIEAIDALILSHYDKDHIGGAEQLIRSFDVKKVFESDFTSDRAEYENYHNALADQGKTAEKLSENFIFSLGKCLFAIDTPKKDQYEKKEDNNASLIVTMSFEEKSFGFFGDALEERISEFLESNPKPVDFAKLPHHGSFHKSYDAFLDQIQCQFAAITCSFKNEPSEKALASLEERGIETYLTQNGTIRVECKNGNITITQN